MGLNNIYATRLNASRCDFMKRIDWTKVLLNAAVAFFSTLVSLLTVDSLLDLNINLQQYIWVCIFVSLINGSLAFCRDALKQIEIPTNKGYMSYSFKVKKKKENILDKMLLV